MKGNGGPQGPEFSGTCNFGRISVNIERRVTSTGYPPTLRLRALFYDRKTTRRLTALASALIPNG